MASQFFWCYDYGTESSDRGTSRSTGVTNWNWSSNTDPTTTYSANPITAGNNSSNLYGFTFWSGTYNQISSVKINHTYNDSNEELGAGLVIKFFPSGSGVGGAGFYEDPSATTDSRLTHDLTSTGAISTGIAVNVGAFGPEYSGKASSSSAPNMVFSEYLVSQLVTTSSASPGDTASATWTVQWNES